MVHTYSKPSVPSQQTSCALVLKWAKSKGPDYPEASVLPTPPMPPLPADFQLRQWAGVVDKETHEQILEKYQNMMPYEEQVAKVT